MYPYREYFPNSVLMLTNTEALADKVLAFPTGQEIDEKAIRQVALMLMETYKNTSGIKRLLKYDESKN